MAKETERIKFKLLQMPCCKMQLCWVNPRLPIYCPECGVQVLARIRLNPEICILVEDEEAMLVVHR